MPSSNAFNVAKRYGNYRRKLDSALGQGMRDALVAVHNEAFDRLSGSGAPFAYPVPIRHPSGGLRSRLGFRRVGKTAGIVFNTDPGAYAVHSGNSPRWGAGAVARPFLDDAVEAADPSARVRRRVIQAFTA